MDPEFAARFVDDWLAGWNAHDLDALLAHFTDDVVFTSPVAVRVIAGSDGVIRGKAALRQYWSQGLRLIPDLHFEMINAYVGVDTLVINHRNQRGGLVCEVLTFDGDRVVSGSRDVSAGADNPAGVRPPLGNTGSSRAGRRSQIQKAGLEVSGTSDGHGRSPCRRAT